jgi:hypothetical protein
MPSYFWPNAAVEMQAKRIRSLMGYGSFLLF